MRLIIAKFGGTSVANEDARNCAVSRIRQLRDEGNTVVAVVSAMGRKGAPYATDTLLGLVDDGASARTRDLLMSCGETISACVFSQALIRAGIASKPMCALTAGIQSDGNYGSAELVSMNYCKVTQAIAEGFVPVITGFQGVADGEINTLGRGGSDSSAACIGAFMHADEVQIYTDVDGVYTDDPRSNPNAVRIPRISCDDMTAMALNGAKVIHPRAVIAAKASKIPLRVLSVFTPDEGTLITD